MQPNRKKLVLMAAAMLGIGLAALPSRSPAASAALPPDDGSDDSSLIPVNCGDGVPVPAVIPGGTVLTLKEWVDDPQGSHDEEIAALLEDTAAAQAQRALLFGLALMDYESVEGGFSHYACEPCDNPETCIMWPSAYVPAPNITYRKGAANGQVWVEADITANFTLYVMCTKC